MKKILNAFSVSMIVVLLLSAFSVANVDASPKNADTKVTITYMASTDWIKDAELELGKKFETETGIHVDYQIIPADQYYNVLKTKLNSGEAADIFGGQSGKSDLQLQYDVEKNAVDLTGEEWTKRMDANALDQVSLNGKVYGTEIWDIVASNYWVVNYNKDIFKKLGISVPKTYDEFKAACETIKAAGITPIYEPVGAGWHHVLAFPSAGPKYEELEPGLTEKLNGNKTTFAENATMLKALTQLDEMYKNGYMGKNALADTYEDTAKNMASGKYAMTIDTLTGPAAIEAAYPDVKADSFGFFPVPLVDNNLQPAHPAGPSKFINAKSTHVKEAKLYFEFIMRPENLQYLLDNEPKFSSLNFSGLKSKLTANQEAFLKDYPVKTIVFQDSVNYVNPQWMDIGKDLVSMYTGQIKPVDVLKSIDTRRTEMAKNAKDAAWK